MNETDPARRSPAVLVAASNDPIVGAEQENTCAREVPHTEARNPDSSGRMNRPRPCWAPIGIRPGVACQLIREYVYLYGAVSPQDGTCVYLIMPAPDTECFQIFLNTLAKKYSREFVLLFVDGAGNHRSDKLVIPANIMMHPLPAYSPELNPQENIWDEIREKIFKNYALKSMDEVYAKLEEAASYIECNPKLVKSITSFPYIVRSL